jgi:hypothetical protein
MVGGLLWQRYINRGGGRGTRYEVHRVASRPTDIPTDLGLALVTGSPPLPPPQTHVLATTHRHGLRFELVELRRRYSSLSQFPSLRSRYVHRKGFYRSIYTLVLSQ